jgi:hypothetical protein
MTAKSKKSQKLSIEEYKKRKETLEKKRFKFSFYPWPVTASLLVPLFAFLCLLLIYLGYVRTLDK